MKSPDDLNVTIIMATMRSHAWPRVFAALREIADTPGLKLYWLPVVYPRERQAAAPEHADLLWGYDAPRWVQPLVIHEEPDCFHCVRKQNAALDALESRGYDGYLMTASDDNLLPKNVGRRLVQTVDDFQKLGTRNAQLGTPLPPLAVVFSHKRGQHVPERNGHNETLAAYPTWDLIAAPKNMAVGQVSGEQYFVHSRALGGWRFPHHGCADGMLAEAMVAARPDLIAYVPDYFTPFNALEPGRWDEEALRTVMEAE